MSNYIYELEEEEYAALLEVASLSTVLNNVIDQYDSVGIVLTRLDLAAAVGCMERIFTIKELKRFEK